jgi:hypothetical protein
MKTIDYTESIYSQDNEYPLFYKKFYPEDRLLFFDIETTGLSARNSTLYLIGVLWFEDNQIQIRQWFNEDGYSEAQLISAFEAFGMDFTALVHFNGLGFDIPYLKQKAEMCDTPFTLHQSLKQIDIFKEIRSYKKIFGLPNMKQVSIEAYLDIVRQDTYNGKELINIYQRYVARPNDTQEKLLLLHNHDDLLGMPAISQILNYKAFFEYMTLDELTITEITTDIDLCKIHFTWKDNLPLPKRLSLSVSGFYLNVIDCKGQLHIPVKHATLKHFFPDYKNYYYLPMEDMAIHKSVASFVEPANRQRATKTNCYVRRTDTFIPCFKQENADIFYETYGDKQGYLQLDELQKAPEDKQRQYVQSLLRHTASIS